MKQIIFISLFLLALCSCEKEKQLIEEIYDEPGYAIGKITKSTSVMFVLTYHYEFKTEQQVTYKGKKEGGISNMDDTRMIGRQYLVVYKKSDPNKSDLNFRYSISSEEEFLKLVAGFKNNPPKP